MPIIDQAGWEKCQKDANDLDSIAIVDVAREVMNILDSKPGPFNPYEIVVDANRRVNPNFIISGFMVGAISNTIYPIHSRGKEFLASMFKIMDEKLGTDV